MTKEKNRASGEFGGTFGAELAPEKYDSYATYGVAPQYKDIPSLGKRFSHDKYVPLEPTYSRCCADDSHDRRKREEQLYNMMRERMKCD